MIMLRTMSAYAPLIPSGPQNAAAYVTKLGQFLRLTSHDELPQVFNILNGSMTFIGPRKVCLASKFELVESRERENIFLDDSEITLISACSGFLS